MGSKFLSLSSTLELKLNVVERHASLAALFSCSRDDASRLHDSMTFVVYRAKEVLIHQGDLGTKVWIVLGGFAQLRVIGSDGQIQLLATYGPGELFGALPQQSISVSDVIAQNTLSVLEISAAKLDALSKESTQISHGLSMILARQYNRLLDRMANRISLTAIGRVYAELLNQANNRDVISPSPVIAALGLRAQTTRETASRAINTLLRRGIISRDGEQLKIVSRTLLEDMVV